MESVLLIAPRAFDLGQKLRVATDWRVSDGTMGKWVVNDGKTRIYISRNDWAREELHPEQLARITACIRDPAYYAIDFSDIELCRRVLSLVADDPRVLVDNDHGIMLRGSEFVELLRTEPDWDWRRDRAR